MITSDLLHALPSGDEGAPDPAFPFPAELKGSLQLLIVDDDRTLRDACASLLRAEGYNPILVGRGDEALELVGRQRFDVVLVDLYMTPVSGMAILREALDWNPDTMVIVMTGNPSVNSSLQALRAGAWEYLPKPFAGVHLLVILGRAVHAVLVARETRALRGQDAEPARDDASRLIGVDPAFRRGVDLARRVAATDASVMISGESGTGKEVVAQFIHRSSRRASRLLVPVNCARLPEPLLESEMFGHRKGAFTGADRDKPGLFETANGGTLFLDELTEMSQQLQAKLLRVLQDGVVRRLGSERIDAIVDVRVISAINGNPHEAVARGALREDLFYRLRVVEIELPPLRERSMDIPLLANHFLSLYWKRHRVGEPGIPRLSASAMECLCTQRWRGNVRELQNVVEHLAVLADPGQEIGPADLPLDATGAGEGATARALARRMLDDTYHLAKEQVVAQFEREYVARLVSRAEGNMSRAARLAGVDRTTLYRLMERHSLIRDDGPSMIERS
jgi:DNA-binding NtrC family response regulator